MSFITICLALVVIISMVYIFFLWFTENNNFYKKAALIPGPPSIPIFGNINLFLGNKKNFLQALNKMYTLYPSPFKTWIGNMLLVCITDPEQIKTLLLNPKAWEKAKFYKCFQPLLGEGIFTAHATKWRKHRKLLAATFKTKTLEMFVKTFQEKAIISMIAMTTEESNESFNVKKYASVYIFNSILNTLMGGATDLDDESINTYMQANERIVELIGYRIKSFHLHSDCMFNLTQASKEIKKKVKIIWNFAHDVIQKRSDSLLTMKEKSDDDSNDCKTFMDLLIEHIDVTKKFTLQDAESEFNTMFMGAFDTSVLLISYTLLILASFPEVQEKVYQEQHDIFNGKSLEKYPIVVDDLDRMDYLDRVIKETLRFFPLVPFIYREAMEDLNIGNCIVPKGSVLQISLSKLHSNEKLWPNPLEFDPDRFLPENMETRHAYSYLPFSAGARNCIGYRYGIIATKVYLSTLLREFIINNDKSLRLGDVKVKQEIFLIPVRPIKIKIKRRRLC